MSSLPPKLPEYLSPGAEFGEFRLIRELGRGGMAVVFEAQEIGLRRRVALKIFHPRFDKTIIDTHRFRREAEVASRLQHSAFARVYSRGVHQGIPFIASELVPDGQNMDELCQVWQKDSTNIPVDHVRLVAKWFAHIAEAMAEAHAKGILHRDLKPANLLVSGSGEAFVVDFGLAWMEGHPGLSQSGEMVGTPFFMCPEQVASGSISHSEKCDIYSLGASLYQMLTLQRPFEAPQAEQVFQSILNEDPQHPKKIRPQLPDDLIRVCLKAMERAPSHRYADIQKFADDLQRFLRHEPVLAQAPSLLRRVVKWRERHPALFVASLLLAVMMGILIRGGLMLQGRDLALQQVESAWSETHYGILMGAADEAIRGFRFDDAANLLNLCEAPLRGWAWRHANRRLQRHLTTLHSPGGPRLLTLAIHPQGTFVMGGFGDGSLLVWNPHSGEPFKEILGFEHGIYATAFSPDGHFAAAAGDDMIVHVFETKNFDPIGVYEGHWAGIGGVAFSHQSNWIVSCDDSGDVHIWDIKSQELLVKGVVPPRAVVVAVAKDDSSIAVADGNGEIQLLSPTTGLALHSALTGHTELVYDLCFLPDGSTLLSCSADRKMIRWNLGISGVEVIDEIVTSSALNSIHPMPGVDKFVLGDKAGQVSLVSLNGQPNGQIIDQWDGHFSFANVVRVSEKGGFLVTGGDDGAVHTWHLDPQRTRALEQRGIMHAELACLSFAGKLATISTQGELHIWDCDIAQRISEHGAFEQQPKNIAISDTGRTIAVHLPDGLIQLFSVDEQQSQVFTLMNLGEVAFFAFEPGAERLLVCDELQAGYFLEMAQGSPHSLSLAQQSALGGKEDIQQLIWANDGLLWVIRQSSIDVLQTREDHWPLLRSYPLDQPIVGAARFGGGIAIAGGHGVYLFQAEPGDAPDFEDVSLIPIETRGLLSLAWHPVDGCLAGGFEDGQIRIWQQSTGAQCASFDGHPDAVHSLGFSQNGDWLISAAKDGSLEFWGTGDSPWPIR